MDNLYYIENIGCDDTTHGLAIIPDEMFEAFKNIIEDLNKNSNCGCMPTIEVWKVTEDDLREPTDDDCKDYVLHLGDKKYVMKEQRWDWSAKYERVI